MKTVTLTEDQLRAADQQGLGLGDLVAEITSAFGIRPCKGCKRRQRKLNRYRIPFLRRKR